MADYEHKGTSDAFKMSFEDKSNKAYLWAEPCSNEGSNACNSDDYNLFCDINSIGHDKTALFGPEIYFIFGLVVLCILF